MRSEDTLPDSDTPDWRGSVIYDATGTIGFKLEQLLGADAMSVTYRGRRQGSDGESMVVLKLMRADFMRAASTAALRSMRKETDALTLLNARTPPNPFIIRLIDASTAQLDGVDVPWVAREYIHGGAEGTTLRERVGLLLAAGDRVAIPRITRICEQLRSALTEIHTAGIVHGDLAPETILCCGSGVDELIKLTGFGSVRSTDTETEGPAADVYAMACVMFFLITGFDPFEGGRLRSVSSSRTLHDDLRSRPSTLKALDEVFQRALSDRIEERPQTASLLASALLGSLTVDARPAASTRRRSLPEAVDSGFHWTTAHGARPDFVIRGAAWNADGRCLAATSAGLSFWNGATWNDVDVPSEVREAGMRFVRRLAPGEWLVGGDRATLALFGARGIEEVLEGPDPSYSIQHASGDLRDLLVFVFVREGEPPTLYCLSNGRWLKPLPLDGVAAINSIARVGDAEWFIAGRNDDGTGFTAHYLPLYWEVRRVELTQRAALSCASVRDIGAIIVGGVDGSVNALIGEQWHRSSLSKSAAIAACAIEPSTRAWLGTANRLWSGWPDTGAWHPVWTGDAQAPIVSIYADGGVVYAMTADGAIIEGRPEDIPESVTTAR